VTSLSAMSTIRACPRASKCVSFFKFRIVAWGAAPAIGTPAHPNYHIIMLLRTLLAALLLAVPGVLAQGLPDLGDVAQAGFTPLQERRLGESIMREIRADRAFYDDAEATDYINGLGNRLASRSTESRQDFEFFLIRDSQINAFALPGGFIGVNTGLMLAGQSESEVAGVLAHEIAHVTQRHIARMLQQQQQSSITSIATLAAALLLARVNTQAAEAAFAFGQAGAIQNQLNFTRENEREADRVGLQILDQAGFDPRGMAGFFERLQRATRVYESGAPSYLRTHPLTFERIADMQNRTEAMGYRQVPDSLEFQLIRAKLRAQLDAPRDAVAFLRENGVRVDTDPSAGLHPGVDYVAHAFDPDGHCVLLYYYMEQLGWDGRPRPRAQRRALIGVSLFNGNVTPTAK